MSHGKGKHAELLEMAIAGVARKAGEVWPTDGAKIDVRARVQGGLLMIFGHPEHAGFSCHATPQTTARLPMVLRGVADDIETDLDVSGRRAETHRTLGEELPREMARVRDRVMPHYLAIGDVGVPALMMMREALDNAARSAISADLVGMVRAYQDLKGFTS